MNDITLTHVAIKDSNQLTELPIAEGHTLGSVRAARGDALGESVQSGYTTSELPGIFITCSQALHLVANGLATYAQSPADSQSLAHSLTVPFGDHPDGCYKTGNFYWIKTGAKKISSDTTSRIG